MSQEKSLLARAVTIVIAMGVIVGVVVFVGSKIRHSHGTKSHVDKQEAWKPYDLIEKSRLKPNRVELATPHEAGSAYESQRRTLKDYYALRAYPGAPPMIPHPVNGELNQTQNCNNCHEKGGFVPKYNSFAPVTPHPEFVNCLQCHGQSNSEKLFRDTTWEKIAPPAIKQPALPGGPPQIPHSMQYRSNCISCHGNPSVPVEIRCSHPERVNCVQCHTPKNTTRLFERSNIGIFKRKETKEATK